MFGRSGSGISMGGGEISWTEVYFIRYILKYFDPLNNIPILLDILEADIANDYNSK